MTVLEYFQYSIRNGYLNKLKWYYSVLSLPSKDVVENDYYTYTKGKYVVKLNNGEVATIDETLKDRPLLTIKDKVLLTNEDMSNIDKEVKTNVGIAIANYLLTYHPFKGKIPFINGEVKVKEIETIIKDLLTNDKSSQDKITIPEYIEFADNAMFLMNISKLVTISATYKTMLPPPGIKEYKKKLIKEFKEKYGDDVFKDYTKVADLEAKLKEYDDDWIKDDPSYGKVLSGKIKNVSRSKLFLDYGAEAAFDKSGIANFVSNSLLEGWPTDPEQLANMYNASRAGSYDRGAETQNGGVAAKIILRATNSIKIMDTDCKTKIGKKIVVAKNNKEKLYGRYMIIGGTNVLFTKENADKYLGKEVEFRSPAYCLTKDNNICRKCSGEELYNYKDGISLLVLQVGAILLYISMSSMHSAILETRTYNPDDALS